MKYLNHGSGRVVLLADDSSYVLKIPYNQNGVNQCKSEYETYCKDSTDKAQIFSYENGIIKMEYLENDREQFIAALHHDFICTLWDRKIDRTLNITCDQNCSVCQHFLAVDERYEQAIALGKKYKTCQVGIDKNGIPKMYDYGFPDEHEIRRNFTPELFMEYWESGVYYDGVLFEDWELFTECEPNYDDTLMAANAFKRRRATRH